jgi:hypothetical protein
MPAIEITRLRAKLSVLAGLVDTPELLVKELLNFYSAYADLTFQPVGHVIQTGNLNSFRSPLLLNREVETAFMRIFRKSPEKALPIVDLLWACQQLEPRQLAASLLGVLPINYSQEVPSRLVAWSHSITDLDDLTWLFNRGASAIRQQQPELWLSMIQNWLETKDQQDAKVSIYTLNSLLSDSNINSLPLIFNFLQPFFLALDPKIMPHLSVILEKLIAKSEIETVFFIKQTLQRSEDPLLLRFIRRNLFLFSSNAEVSIKSFLRSRN